MTPTRPASLASEQGVALAPVPARFDAIAGFLADRPNPATPTDPGRSWLFPGRLLTELDINTSAAGS